MNKSGKKTSYLKKDMYIKNVTQTVCTYLHHKYKYYTVMMQFEIVIHTKKDSATFSSKTD